MINAKIEALKKWFQEKKLLIHKFFMKHKKISFSCYMGDIYFAKIGVNLGREIDKHRPVLVFQANTHYHHYDDMVFVIPITTTLSHKKYCVYFDKNDLESGFLQPGKILLRQSRHISKIRLLYKMGVLKKSKLQEIQIKFEQLFYKNTTLEIKKFSRATNRQPHA